MADNMEQQSAQQPEMQQERPEIKNPLESLKASSEKIAKFGGFDLIESTIEGTQNLSPDRKARRNIFLTERGTSFGYNNLVVDIRSFPVLRSFGYPVIFDVTHSLQLPGGEGSCSGGQREFAGPLARAAVAAGVDGLFMEVHPEPDNALCDGPNMIPLETLPQMLKVLKSIHELIASQTPDTGGA